MGLLRHWSLLEALRYSPYVAVRLHTWRGAGQHMLHLLLARCGVPLKQAKLAYSALLPGSLLLRRTRLLALPPLEISLWIVGTLCVGDWHSSEQSIRFPTKYRCMAALQKAFGAIRNSSQAPALNRSLTTCQCGVWLQ